MAAELEVQSSARYLAGTLGDIEITLYRDGTATSPDTLGTVTVTDQDGNELATGSASSGGTGILRLTPSAAALAEVNLLTVEWAGIVFGAEPAITLTTTHEVIGAALFTEAQARAFDDGALAGAAYSDAMIRDAHDRILDGFEDALGYPLGRRYRQITEDGTGRERMRIPLLYVSAVRAISTRAAGAKVWAAMTADDLADVVIDRNGYAIRELRGVWPEGVQNVRFSLEAGATIPAEIRRAALMVARYGLVPSDVDDRALFLTNQLGQFRISTPGTGHPYGIPEVDQTLEKYRARVFW